MVSINIESPNLLVLIGGLSILICHRLSPAPPSSPGRFATSLDNLTMKTYLTEYTENDKSMLGEVQADSWAEAELAIMHPDEEVVGELIYSEWIQDN